MIKIKGLRRRKTAETTSKVQVDNLAFSPVISEAWQHQPQETRLTGYVHRTRDVGLAHKIKVLTEAEQSVMDPLPYALLSARASVQYAMQEAPLSEMTDVEVTFGGGGVQLTFAYMLEGSDELRLLLFDLRPDSIGEVIVWSVEEDFDQLFGVLNEVCPDRPEGNTETYDAMVFLNAPIELPTAA